MKQYAWWFSNLDCKLRYDDDRVAEVGITHEVNGELKMCRNGLHASKDLRDALLYAPGNILWLVELGGETISQSDKICARTRTYIAKIDAIDTIELLQEFARKCALEVVHLWDAPEVVIDYLKTGDEELRKPAAAAADAYAAYAAAAYASYAAADAADAAYAAYAAFAYASYASADAAAADAAYTSTRSGQNQLLTEMVLDKLELP